MKQGFLKKLLVTAAITAAVSAVATVSAAACTTIYVGGNLTEEGTPFVARTEDYGSDMNKLWFISEAGHFREGDLYLGCPGYGEFEWTFTHDSYRFTYFTNDVFNGTCPECGEEDPTHWSYTEFGTNEKGVSVSATETISGSSAVKAIDPNVKKKVDGIVGIEETDIPTIILAEAGSAREGVELLARIYDEYGAYADSGIFICDQNEVWYIENCSGHQYVAIRLNDDIVFLEPNLAVIGEVDLDDENVIASEGLIATAKAAGTFVGDEEENIIDFRASYANLGTEASPRVGAPRMVDGLKFLNDAYDYTQDDLYQDNTKFTISNVKDGGIVPMYTNITPDRQLTKDDVFNFYKLSSVGKPSNQEIEIFQLFKDRPVETGTVGWVGVGNMSNNVFVPYYPMLLEDMYEGYQVSTEVASISTEKPDGFCTWGSGYVQDADGKWQRVSGYKVYPENWRDSYYFTFEGLGGYILYAEQIDGAPVSDADKQYVLDQLSALQHAFYDEFEAMDPEDTTEVGMDMARRAHELGLELIDYVTSPDTAVSLTYMDGGEQVDSTRFYQPGKVLTAGEALQHTGYVFRGWDTDASADEVVVKAGESFTITDDTVLYAVWTQNTYSGGSSGGSSSGSSAPTTYAVSVESAENGSVAVSPKSASRGTVITIAVTPDKGYTLETLTVSGTDGKEIAVKEKDGKYTFTMPASKVTVEATFMEDNSMLNYFVDVPAGAYYYDAVLWAAGKGITGGTDAVHFSPNAACTRAQAVTFLWRAAGSPVVDGAISFTDVSADAYYADAVRWAVSQGITKGTTDTTFSPNATCTRAQIVTFIYRSVQAQGGGFTGEWMFLLPFTDAPDWAYEAIAWCYQEGITGGTTDTTFSPNADCTRAQIVTFLYRDLAE